MDNQNPRNKGNRSDDQGNEESYNNYVLQHYLQHQEDDDAELFTPDDYQEPSGSHGATLHQSHRPRNQQNEMYPTNYNWVRGGQTQSEHQQLGTSMNFLDMAGQGKDTFHLGVPASYPLLNEGMYSTSSTMSRTQPSKSHALHAFSREQLQRDSALRGLPLSRSPNEEFSHRDYSFGYGDDYPKDEDEDAENSLAFPNKILDLDHYLRIKGDLGRDIRRKADDPENQGKIPSRAVQQNLARQLFDAAWDCSQCKDNRGSRDVRAFETLKYSAKEVEMMCWEVLLSSVGAQLGVRNTPKWFPMPFETTYDSVDARVQVVITGFQKSKAMVKMALDPLYGHRLGDFPTAELKRKGLNRTSNESKAAILKTGSTALATQPEIVDQADFKDETQRQKAKQIADRKAQEPATPGAVATPRSSKKRKARDQSNTSTSKSKQPRSRLAQTPSQRADRSDEEEIPTPNPSTIIVSGPNRTSTLENKESVNAAKQSAMLELIGEQYGISEYREILCELLNVPPLDVQDYNLNQLRFYCRRYLKPFWNKGCFDNDGAVGGQFQHHRISIPQGQAKDKKLAHFVEDPDFAVYRNLAILREDIDPKTGKWIWAKARKEILVNAITRQEHRAVNEEIEAKALESAIRLPSFSDSPETWKALGLVDNEIGQDVPQCWELPDMTSS